MQLYHRNALQGVGLKGRVKPISEIYLNEWKIMGRQNSGLKIACPARNTEEAERIMGIDRRWILRISRKQWIEIRRCLRANH